ncbi:MAG: ketopantoate reductase family protein [Acidithiobacillales bacterium]
MTIVGTGALATLFAARLGAIVPVTLLGTWAEAIESFRRQGAVIESDAATVTSKVAATNDPEECRGTRLAFVLVKAGATGRAAGWVRSFLDEAGLAVTLQNGLGNAETLASALGADRVVVGAAEVGATLLAPGRARHGGGNRVRLAAHARAGEVAELLSQAGFEVEVVPGAERLLWEKLAATAPLLPLTALLGVPNGEVLRRPSSRTLLEAAAREVAATARTAGIDLPGGEAAEAVLRVIEATAGNVSSMLQDVRRGVRTEIDALNGAVVREARRRSVAAPVNEALWLAVRALDEGCSG